MANAIIDILQYPDESAGSLMITQYVELSINMTVADAFAHIEQVGNTVENIYTCYVVDDEHRLTGLVSARTMLLADPETPIADLMESNIVTAHIHDDQEATMSDIRKYGFMTIPIVDDDERMVGIFTFDEAFTIQDEEATEDFEKMAAISPSEHPYLATGVLELAKHRIPWLFLLMVFATFTGMLVELFESSLAALPALVSFVAVLMNTGGNAGTQSSTLIIRGMALGEITLADVLRVLGKEITVSLICGAVLFATTFASVLFFGEGAIMALTVSLAMFITIMTSNLIGGFLTFLAKLIKVDPAVMAAPLLTNIIDALSLLVYFSLARVLLGI